MRILGLTVREALALGPLAEARVLAGAGGLDREIEHVTVVDAPDAADWLRGGEFVLTTAYAAKDTSESQVDLIRRLIATRAAALGIKLRRFIDALSDEALACAEQGDFPIIELPYEVSWADIITPVLGGVLQRQAEVLQRSMDIHTQFIQTVLGGGGMHDIAATLADQIGAPVAVVDVRWDILGSVGSPAEACPGLDADWAGEVGMLAAVEGGKSQGVKITSNAWDLAQDMSRICVSPTSDDSTVPPHSLITASIGSHGSTFGRLLVMEPEDELLDEMDAIAIGHAVTTAMVEVLRLRTAEDVERRFRVNFWDGLIHKRFNSQAEAVKKARTFGVDLTCPNMVITVAPDPAALTSDGIPLMPESELVRLQDEITLAISRLPSSFSIQRLGVFPYRQGVSIILPWKGDVEDVVSARAEAIRVATELHEFLRSELTPETVSVGVGRYYKDPMAIAVAYREASQSANFGRIIFGPNSLTHFDEIGLYRIISRCTDHAELRNFVNDHLGVVEAYDLNEGTELLRTLEVYLSEGCNATAAADRMFVHVNTLNYRLGRLERLAGIDLKNAETRFNLELALRIRRYLKVIAD